MKGDSPHYPVMPEGEREGGVSNDRCITPEMYKFIPQVRVG